jgi:hypothetical protein
VLQVAISIVLLIAAGLFIRTLHNLRTVDVGFNTQNLVTFRVSPGLNRYDEPRMTALYQQMIDRLRAVPDRSAHRIEHRDRRSARDRRRAARCQIRQRREPAPPTEYVPLLQSRMPTAIFQVRTAGDPLSVSSVAL